MIYAPAAWCSFSWENPFLILRFYVWILVDDMMIFFSSSMVSVNSLDVVEVRA